MKDLSILFIGNGTGKEEPGNVNTENTMTIYTDADARRFEKGSH